MFLILWVIFSFVCAAAGSGKRIGYWGCFFCCLLLSPLIGLIIGIASASDTPPPQQVVHVNTATKAEQIERLAKLKDSGALTAEEFDAEKKKILA